MQLKHLLLPAILLWAATGLTAQWNLVRETEKIMSLGNRPALRIDFTNTTTRMAEDAWKDFVKQNFGGKVKKDRKSGEWVATGCRAGYVSGGDFTVYAIVETSNNNTVFHAWFDTGNYFLNSRNQPEATRETADALRQYYFDVRRAAIGEELKVAEKQLSDEEGKLKKLQRDNDNLYKSIEDYKARIKKAEEDIVQNTKEQEAAIINIDAQKRRTEDIRKRIQNVEQERQ